MDNVVSGYNSAIFVYGQTGAGKTFTMMGELGAASDGSDDEQVGPLLPGEAPAGWEEWTTIAGRGLGGPMQPGTSGRPP